MPKRRAQPYFKQSHQAWYVNFRGKPVRLAAEEEAAWAEYHRLMAGDEPATASITVAAVLEAFLVWANTNRKPSTMRYYRQHLPSFVKYVGPRLKVADLKPYQATRWLEATYKRSKTGAQKRCGAVAISTAFNWAAKQGMIPKNPLGVLEKPAPTVREAYLAPEHWKILTFRLEDNPLLDILSFMRETGCRPWEARHAEARHWDRAGEFLKLELELTKGKKGKKLPRIIRLNDAATAIVQRLALKYPDGPLFRNGQGKRWSGAALEGRCLRLRDRLGFEIFPYIFRHTFCTDALLRGVDPITVSLLMGHKNGAMVMKVYNHLIHQSEHLKEKLRQATGQIPSIGNETGAGRRSTASQ